MKILRRCVCTILIFLLFAFAALGLVACNKGRWGRGSFPVGTRPRLENRISADDLTLINSAIDSGDVDALKTAALRLYDIANASCIEDGKMLMLQETMMGVNFRAGPNTTIDNTDFLGMVKMHGFTLKSGKDWYNQFVAQVVGGTAEMAMGYFSTMVKVSYHLDSEPEKYFFNIIKRSEVEANCNVARFPYASFKLIQQATEYDLDGYKNAANVLDAPNEIYNMKFMKEILADDVKIAHEDGIFKVSFSVDPNADRALLEQWFEKPKRDVAEGGQTLKSYLRFICELEVWDNGYAKSYYADYARDAGYASGATVDSFGYLWNEDEILKIISDDFRLDSVSAEDKKDLSTIDDYIKLYTDFETVKAALSPFYIALIVIGCAAFAAIVAAIVVDILVRKGKLPKLAAKRYAKKQKRIAKKTAKKNYAKTPYVYGNDAPTARTDLDNVDLPSEPSPDFDDVIFSDGDLTYSTEQIERQAEVDSSKENRGEEDAPTQDDEE